jgi:hypothetical protein
VRVTIWQDLRVELPCKVIESATKNDRLNVTVGPADEPVGSEVSVRIAVNTRGEFHRYDRTGCHEEKWHSGA